MKLKIERRVATQEEHHQSNHLALREERWVRAPQRRYKELPGVEPGPESSSRLRRSARRQNESAQKKLPKKIFEDAAARLDDLVSEMRSRRAACAKAGEFDEAEGFDEMRCYCQFVAQRLDARDIDSLGMASVLLSTSITEPKDYDEAMARPAKEAAEWKKATDSEWESWKKKEVFEWVHAPAGAQVIDLKLVYKLKLDAFNIPVRYKARLVARGFQQTGVEMIDAFAPMAHPTTIRLLVSIAAANGWDIKQSDISTAYLSAELPETIYLAPPKGMERSDGKVMALRRAVYGLATSGALWHSCFVDKMSKFGMVPITDDDTIFRVKKTDKDGKERELIVAIVVDDCMMTGDSEELRLEWVEFMRGFFELTYDGDLQYYLGVRYERSAKGIKASQTAYLERCLARLGKTNCNSSPTPMDARFAVTPDDIDEHPDPAVLQLFQSMIGCLIYLSVWTRLDIAYAVNVLARFMAKPTKALITAAKRAFRYLRGTPSRGIHFPVNYTGPFGKHVLYAYADASDSDCKITARSTGGHILFVNGAPIAWKSGRQPLVTLSSAESEYVQATSACTEIIYVRSLLERAGIPQAATILYDDNQAAIEMSKKPCHRQRSKHIRRRFHFVRDCCLDGTVKLIHVRSEWNAADAFTKPLPEHSFVRLTKVLHNEPETTTTGTTTAGTTTTINAPRI